MTPGTPRALAERFTRHVLSAEQRVEEWVEVVEQEDSSAPDGLWLDVGCGTADLLAVVARRGRSVVGVDVAFRWLVAARRRLEQQGIHAVLVCANGEHLPFRDHSFARVFSLGTLEHCRDAARVVGEAGRVTVPGGVVRIRTVNRYTPLPEPHVNVWGVGFVPRRWADAYVQSRNGQRYLHHRPLSPRELARALRRAQLQDVRVQPAQMLADERARLPRILSWAAPVYEWARRMPALGRALAWAAPLIEARAVGTAADGTRAFGSSAG
jgi:ubiquinone/menaquinone biosynthesis C-methylase UbiE